MVDMMPVRKLNKELSHMPGVRTKVRSFAEQAKTKGAAALLKHRETGNAKVEVSHGKTDSLVSLSDPGGNAMAIEFGHQWELYGQSGYTPGLRILTDAIYF